MAKQNGTLKEHAIWLHEWYNSLLAAGFEKADAFGIITESVPKFPGTEDDDE